MESKTMLRRSVSGVLLSTEALVLSCKLSESLPFLVLEAWNEWGCLRVQPFCFGFSQLFHLISLLIDEIVVLVEPVVLLPVVAWHLVLA